MFKYNWCQKKKRIPPPLVSNQVPLKKKKKPTIKMKQNWKKTKQKKS